MPFAVVLAAIGLLALSLTFVAAHFTKAKRFRVRVEVFHFLRFHVDIEEHHTGGGRHCD